MAKLYVHLTENGNIFESSTGVQNGWTQVENDPAFNIENMMQWTVRQADNCLVHISTGMTPDEEKTQADALLGKTVGTALATANTASQKADNAVAGLAQLGKTIAPLVVATQTITTDGEQKNV